MKNEKTGGNRRAQPASGADKTMDKSTPHIQEPFHLVIESAPDAIFIQTHGCFAYLNATALKLFGAENSAQLLGKPALERFHPDFRQQVAARIQTINTQNQPVSQVEEKILRLDGQTVEVEVSAVPFVYNQVHGGLVFMRDISRRKKTEESLQLKDHLINMTSEMAKVGGWEFDTATGKGTWTAEVARIHDVDPSLETDIAKGLDFYSGDSRFKFEKALEDAISLAKPYDLELEMVSAKGLRKWVRTIGVPVVEGGKVIKLRGYFQDITEREQAEEKYRLLFNEMLDGFALHEIICDDQGNPADYRFLAINPAFERMTGLDANKIIGKTVLEVLPGTERYWIERYGHVALTGKSAVFEDYSGELKKHFMVSAFRPAPDQFACIFTDITKRKLAEEAIRTSENSLARAEAIAGLGYWEINLRDRRVNSSLGARAIYGIANKELTLADIQMVPLPEYREMLDKTLEGLIKRNEPYDVEFKIRRINDGKILDVHSVAEYDAVKDVVFGIIHDITERKKAEAEVLRLNRLYAVISQVNQAVVRAKTEEQFLETVCQVITEFGGFKLAWIGKVAPEGKQVLPVAVAGEAKGYVDGIVVYTTDDRPEGLGPTGKCIRSLQPFIQNDFMNDANTLPWREKAKLYGLRGSAAFPIVIDGQAWGAIMVYSDTEGYFGQREKNLLQEAAGDIGFALENIRKEKLRLWAEDALRRGNEELALLYDASQELSRSLDLKEVCRALLGFISRATPCDSLMVSAYHADSQLISCLYSFDKKSNEVNISSFPPIPLEPEGKGTQSLVIRSGQSLLLPDYESYRRTASTSYFISESGKLETSLPDDAERTRSAILVPLKSEGRVVGVIQVFSNTLNAFSREHLRLVESLSLHAAAAITNALLYGRIQQELQEREEAEEALHESEERFRSLYENSSIGIYRTTPDGRILLANPALVAMLGYSSFAELARKNLDRDFFEPLYPRSTFIDKVEKEGEIRGLESAWKRKDGSFIYVRESARAIRDMHDKTLYYDGTVEDITERKSVEEALMESEEKFRNLAEQSPNIIFINVGGRIAYTNSRAVEMMGYSREELYSPQFDFMTLSAPEYRGDMNANFAKHVQGLEVPPIEYVILTKNGKPINAILTTRLIDFRGEKAILGTITDITERKKADEERRRLEEKAQIASRLAAVGEMAAGIAHEINNPLTSVIGFSELLMEQELPADVMEEIKIIADGSRRVADIVKRLLTFARQNKPARTGLNINALIDNTLKMRTYVLQTANISVYTCYDQDLPWIAADPGQLQQVFLNLIVNAEHAMKSAHNGGQLSIITERRDNHIRIVFRDNGPGIPPENLGRLFEPFFTTKGPGEGTGLGLSLSHSIVLEHGGEIWAESEPGQGAIFIVELPISEAVEPAKAEASSGTPENIKRESRARILVVDDEPSVREYMQAVLTVSGHTVDGTGDPEEALRIIDNNSYQVIFIDVRMPGMSGMELYQHILKKHPALSRRIIFITGDTSDAGVKTFLANNQINFLAKPFEAGPLEEKVRSILAAN